MKLVSLKSKTIRTLLEETFTLQGATRSKTAKTAVLPEFCLVERGGGGSIGPSTAAAVVCLSCLPKIFAGGSVLKFIEKKKNQIKWQEVSKASLHVGT